MGEDEGSIAQIVPLYDNYYETHNYSFPWVTVNNRGVDYIDYIEVKKKKKEKVYVMLMILIHLLNLKKN